MDFLVGQEFTTKIKEVREDLLLDLLSIANLTTAAHQAKTGLHPQHGALLCLTPRAMTIMLSALCR